jgi:hypothetical protein
MIKRLFKLHLPTECHRRATIILKIVIILICLYVDTFYVAGVLFISKLFLGDADRCNASDRKTNGPIEFRVTVLAESV